MRRFAPKDFVELWGMIVATLATLVLLRGVVFIWSHGWG